MAVPSPIPLLLQLRVDICVVTIVNNEAIYASDNWKYNTTKKTTKTSENLYGFRWVFIAENGGNDRSYNT